MTDQDPPPRPERRGRRTRTPRAARGSRGHLLRDRARRQAAVPGHAGLRGHLAAGGRAAARHPEAPAVPRRAQGRGQAARRAPGAPRRLPRHPYPEVPAAGAVLGGRRAVPPRWPADLPGGGSWRRTGCGRRPPRPVTPASHEAAQESGDPEGRGGILAAEVAGVAVAAFLLALRAVVGVGPGGRVALPLLARLGARRTSRS